MAIAAVVLVGDVGKLAHLQGRQGAIRNGDAQHVGVELEVEAVHQPERLELVLGQLTGQAAGGLVAELRHALGDEIVVELIVAVHRCSLSLYSGGKIGAEAVCLLAKVGAYRGAKGADALADVEGADMAVAALDINEIGIGHLVVGNRQRWRGFPGRLRIFPQAPLRRRRSPRSSFRRGP